MAINDIWQIRAVGSYLGKTINNIFWYRQISPGGINDAYDAAYGLYYQKLSPAIRLMQHITFTWERVIATNWTTGTQQDEYAIVGGLAGAIADGEGSPSFVSWSFRYQKTSPIYSSGGKRFAGVPEVLVNGNTSLIPVGDLNGIRSALATGLVQGGYAAAPCVLVTAVAGIPQNTAMADPPYITWDVNNVIFNGVSTQRTRK